MKSFKDFNIERSAAPGFAGDKIKIAKILNCEIIVMKYKIEKSDYPNEGNGMRTVLQFKYKDELRIVWTSSIPLQTDIQKVTEFPFKTTIIKDTDDTFQFT